ncbi:hypothetical protein EDB87DRAFT_1581887 [Lactarius vividus]|nr:hypothetical protein EDB87DRAFT_1581887 [Lactarius vividus]
MATIPVTAGHRTGSALFLQKQFSPDVDIPISMTSRFLKPFDLRAELVLPFISGDVPRRNHAQNLPRARRCCSMADPSSAARQPKSPNKHLGPNAEALGFVENPEKLVPATLPHLKRQEHFAAMNWARSSCAMQHLSSAAPDVGVSCRDPRAPVVLRQRAREGREASRGVGSRQRAVCDRPRLKHCPGFEECMREALWILLGDEVEKRVDMGLSITLGALRATNNKKF